MVRTTSPFAGRRLSRRFASRRFSRGASTVEFAIMAPIIVALILWSNYFWEVQMARIKAAEAARFVAFERTVRTDVSGIAAEAKDRCQDLDCSNKVSTGGKTAPIGYKNGFTMTVTARDVDAPITSQSMDTKGGGGLGGVLGKVTSAIGSGLGDVLNLIDFKTDKGAVQVNVEVKIQNRWLPGKIANYTSRKNSETDLNITLKEQFYVYHDTWRAWNKGSDPRNTYSVVQGIVAGKMPKIAYLGLTSISGLDSILEIVGKVLDVLQLDWPLRASYASDTTLIKKVKESGRHDDYVTTRTVPGDRLQAAYWKSDSNACRSQGCLPNQELRAKYGYQGSNGAEDSQNWPMRAYNCRGPYFQGANKSDKLEYDYATDGSGSSYFVMNNKACVSQ